MSEINNMTTEELTAMDTTMMSDYYASGTNSLTDEHRSVKAELGYRSAERARKESRARAAKKASATRTRRAAAGLPPMRRTFSLDNAPTGGWTEADRV
jgi:hypothetical protein